MTILEHLKEKWKAELVSDYPVLEIGYKDAFHDLRCVRWEEVGEYQGDIFAIIEGPNGWGFIKIGYGSCSGCDHLDAVMSDAQPENRDYGSPDAERSRANAEMEAAAKALEEIRGNVHWEQNREALLKWMEEVCDKEILDTYMDEEERPKVWRELMSALHD